MPQPCSPECAEFNLQCPGATCIYRPDPPREIRDLAARVLADPGWTRLVVCAAVRAERALARADVTGRTADGDSATMTARSVLRTALIDAEALSANLTKET